MESTKTDTERKRFEILYGGSDLTVLVRTSETEIVPEKVKVLKIPIKDLPKFSDTMTDEVAEAAFYVTKPKEWVESEDPNYFPRLADPEDFVAIVEEGRRLNASVFQRWAATRKEWCDMMGIDIKAVTKLMKQAESSPSPKSSSS